MLLQTLSQSLAELVGRKVKHGGHVEQTFTERHSTDRLTIAFEEKTMESSFAQKRGVGF